MILAGSSVPFILRKRLTPQNCEGDLEYYRYIGEAYCSGVMDGRFFEAHVENLRKIRIM
jgi:hypothetical protein